MNEKELVNNENTQFESFPNYLGNGVGEFIKLDRINGVTRYMWVGYVGGITSSPLNLNSIRTYGLQLEMRYMYNNSNQPRFINQNLRFFPKPSDFAKKVIDDIISNKMNQCLNQVLYVLKNGGALKENFDYFNKGGASYNWNIESGNANGKVAQTRSLLNNGTRMRTVLNISKYNNATNLFWAKTLLHESVHAYLVSNYLSTKLSDSNKAKLFMNDDENNSWTTAVINKGGHEYMASNYVRRIAMGLEDYCLRMNIPLDREYLANLAWSGLQHTDAYKKLPEARKKAINETFLIERQGVNLKGQSVKQKGERINCK
ncbi:hypothetical protein EI427_25595 (plasmid) [Flammeovirga pectinis]|uniref:SprT-like domain-containing protein n=1 Tax=Flammeovirga pectinis TaxID=2494373 RepID=A0A3Q9FVX2_9BACT|nr:hypothetical protein [Flammeovirga pectinis]AZQ65612.1 hypothetical protein EI427_25595 [Flammeovirga pectinis]